MTRARNLPYYRKNCSISAVAKDIFQEKIRFLEDKNQDMPDCIMSDYFLKNLMAKWNGN